MFLLSETFKDIGVFAFMSEKNSRSTTVWPTFLNVLSSRLCTSYGEIEWRSHNTDFAVDSGTERDCWNALIGQIQFSPKHLSLFGFFKIMLNSSNREGVNPLICTERNRSKHTQCNHKKMHGRIRKSGVYLSVTVYKHTRKQAKNLITFSHGINLF